jgi:hypothetical protein
VSTGKKWQRADQQVFQERGLSSSSSGGLYIKPKKPGGCYCSIGRTEKGDDAALITLGSIGIPLAIAGAIFGGSLSGNSIGQIFESIGTAITDVINAIAAIGGKKKKRSGEGGVEEPASSRHLLLPFLTWPTLLIQKYYKPLSWAALAIEDAGRSLQDSAAVHMWRALSRGLGNNCGRSIGERRIITHISIVCCPRCLKERERERERKQE